MGNRKCEVDSKKKEGYLKLEYSNYSFIAYVIFGV